MPRYKTKRASTISQNTCLLLTNLRVEARQTQLSLDVKCTSTSSMPKEVGSINDLLRSSEPLWLTIKRICQCMTAVVGESANVHVWPQTLQVVILHLS